MSAHNRKKSLFDEICDFPIPTYDEWKRITEQSLKGAPFSKLLTETYEGITLQPMYQQKDIEHLTAIHSFPGEYPYLRGTNVTKGWLIAQEIEHPLLDEANQFLKTDTSNGVNAINIKLSNDTRNGRNLAKDRISLSGITLSSLDDVSTLFKDIDIEQYPFIIHAGANILPILALVRAYLKTNHISDTSLKGIIGADPFAAFVQSGEVIGDIDDYLDQMSNVLTWTTENEVALQTILIEGHPYHDGGANAAQELAFMLATAVYYIRELQKRGHSLNNIIPTISFSMSVGGNLFMELAKIRAARLLWANICTAFGCEQLASKLTIHAKTSNWTKTVYDPHVNILRGTVEAFTAAVAGVNSLHVIPFNSAYELPTALSRRIARNVQLVLQEESHILQTADPAGGSWYVENITNQLAEKSWELFQSIEEAGGMFVALQKGIPQQLVQEVSERKQKDIELRKEVFIGATIYPNKNEKLPFNEEQAVKEALQNKASKLFNIKNEGKCPPSSMEECIEALLKGATIEEISIQGTTEKSTSWKRIEIRRGAEYFEQLRMHAEKQKQAGDPYTVSLINLGKLADYKPRADFITNFLETGGFQLESSDSLLTVEEAVQSMVESSCHTFVLCGKNECYEEMALEIVQNAFVKRNELTIFVAGKQSKKLEDELLKVGLHGFIHMGTNCYELLKELQEAKGGITVDEC